MWLGKTAPTWASLALTAAAAAINSPQPFDSALRDIQVRNAGHACRTVKVVSGDSCDSLASKCHISGAEYTKYNPAKDFCSSLQPGQLACCTSGGLQDIKPKQNADGSCATYTVQHGDYCDQIAVSHGLTSSDISNFNDKTTWGWTGCGPGDLMAGTRICLSEGTPPLPAPVDNAVCGPTVPGTKYPKAGETLADLNPCPLNVCCDTWGQCGQMPEFCTVQPGLTGNPGTAAKGKNSCISNCGLDIHNNGYYASWNWERPCLNYRASDFADTDFTYAHWAFAGVGPDYTVSINDTMEQLPLFLGIPQKKILSFGGWALSTSPSTYNDLRSAMDPGNVDTFISNIIGYLNENGFDGVDIDWEYPGATDIPNIPPGKKSDGPNYLAFLKKLRAKMSDKLISIAAPASYWYLKEFPIAQMAEVLDYIVFMTYDLHGNHVNLTETTYALSMITKAGVPAEKVVVGVANYGRSFEMSNPAACMDSIHSPDCKFTGPDSGAEPGVRAQTRGYISNAESQQLLQIGQGAAYKFDPVSDSDMVFNGTTWIGGMSNLIKTTRTAHYKSLKLGGTVEWAPDLEAFNDDMDNPWGNYSMLPPAPELAPCDKKYDTLEELEAVAGTIPFHCVTPYTLHALKQLLDTAMANYTALNDDGYNSKFETYAKAIVEQADKSVHDFIYQHGNKYFTCEVTEQEECCSTCKKDQPSDDPNYCAYCFHASSCWQTGTYFYGAHAMPKTNEPTLRFVNHTEPCPPDFSKRGFGTHDQSVYWSLDDSKSKEFYAELYAKTGIPEKRTKIGEYYRNNNCYRPGAGEENAPAVLQCSNVDTNFNVPVPDGYAWEDIKNPNAVVEKVAPKTKHLGPEIDMIQTLLKLHGWFGDGSQLIDAVSLPILMLAQATENMENVVTIAEKIDAERRKELILEFLSAIFLFIPIAGEVAGAFSALADVAIIMDVVGVVGNVATDVYGMVSTKGNPLVFIMDLILTPLALSDVATISKAAQARRAMKEDDIAKLGKSVSRRTEIINKVKGKCKSFQ